MTEDLNTPLRQLRFQLTREDIAAYHFLPRELKGWEKLWLFGPILACGAAAGFFEDSLKQILPWDPDAQIGQLMTVLVAIAIGYGMSLILLTARTRHRINSASVPAQQTVVDVYPQLLFAGEEGDQSSYAWSKLTVIETAAHVFLGQAGRAPVILPLRAFRDASDMANFAAMARALGNDDDATNDNFDDDAEPDATSAAKENT